jgi:anti-anti-sigma factor
MPEDIAAVRVARREPVLVLMLEGEIDLSNVADVEAEVARLAEDASGPPVLDLTNVSYIDSSGARMLMDLRALLALPDLEMAVVAPEASIARRVIDLVGLPITVHESLQGAVASLRVV